MWGNNSPSTIISDDWRTKWFAYPFGVSERCRALDQWATGKHQGNVKPALLSDDWLRPNAEIFFDDYEAMILSFCQAKWGKLMTPTEQKADLESESGFVFADNGENKSKIEIHQKWNKQMMAALLYYSSEILEPELRTRLVRLRIKKPTLTWADAKALIVKHMESPDARMTLINLTCAKRADGEALLDWIQCILSHKTKCTEVNMTLPDTLWVDLAWCQITSTERQICGEKSNTLETLETKVNSMEPRDLPIYRQGRCSRELARIPTLPDGKSKRQSKRNAPRDSGATPKPDKLCSYCGKLGHVSEVCRKKATVKPRE